MFTDADRLTMLEAVGEYRVVAGSSVLSVMRPLETTLADFDGLNSELQEFSCEASDVPDLRRGSAVVVDEETWTILKAGQSGGFVSWLLERSAG